MILIRTRTRYTAPSDTSAKVSSECFLTELRASSHRSLWNRFETETNLQWAAVHSNLNTRYELVRSLRIAQRGLRSGSEWLRVQKQRLVSYFALETPEANQTVKQKTKRSFGGKKWRFQGTKSRSKPANADFSRNLSALKHRTNNWRSSHHDSERTEDRFWKPVTPQNTNTLIYKVWSPESKRLLLASRPPITQRTEKPDLLA